MTNNQEVNIRRGSEPVKVDKVSKIAYIASTKKVFGANLHGQRAGALDGRYSVEH
jgi:hypothetical protein